MLELVEIPSANPSMSSLAAGRAALAADGRINAEYGLEKPNDERALMRMLDPLETISATANSPTAAHEEKKKSFERKVYRAARSAVELEPHVEP